MSRHSAAETFEANDCSIVLRRVDGPEATELFLACQPRGERAEAGQQAEAAYRAVLGALRAEGASFEAVVCQTVFLRDLRAHLEPVRAARRRVLGRVWDRPATTEIEQPPLAEGVCLEVAVQALVPRASPARVDAEGGAHGLRVLLGDEERLYAGGLCGPGEDAYTQTLAMFEAAEDLLGRADMAFGDVVRTWIHLRDMDRDYGDLNRARRAFFASRGIEPVPASTGIGGAPASGEHDLCLGVYAVKAGRPLVRTVMSAPTLNEAGSYGADFVRGMKVAEANKVALHVSGTASIDEAGRTAHEGDFDAQADRMLMNVAALLEGQGASFADVVSAITYLKDPAHAPRLREELRRAGFEGFPHVLVEAPICRPGLLCETEALAVLPRDPD